MSSERPGARRRTRTALTTLPALVAVLAVGVAACGGSSSSSGGSSSKAVNPNGAEVSPAGDIPDNQAYVAYRPPGGGYSVKVPEGWARSTSGRTVAFTDKLNTIQMETTPASAPMTVARARRSELPRLARSEQRFQAGRVSTVSRSAGRATRITYLADSRPDPVTGKVRRNAVERYVFFRRGRDVVLTLSGPKGADNVDPWKIVTDSVRWTR
ncbi:MAG: hypothetical protein QOD81_4264 [Solirubrobacteraceae bacterium]|jgi:hypothetical protein|nr:hypothetical protein [Solirubrobacteraceae bacterium]